MYNYELDEKQKEDSLVIVSWLRDQLQVMETSKLHSGMNKVEWIGVLNDILDNLKYEVVKKPTHLGSSEDKLKESPPPFKRKPLTIGDLK